MDTRVKPAYDDLARVNASLILFVKIAAAGPARVSGLAAGVVILAFLGSSVA
jgi:hypothetical protein